MDEDGQAILTHLPRRLALYHFSFKASVSALAFSPSSRYLAVGVGRSIELWHAPLIPSPASDEGLEFAPFVRHRVLAGHHDTVQGLDWSSDSRFFLSSSKDLTARIWRWSSIEDFTPTTLGGHKEAVIGAWFSADQELVRPLCASCGVPKGLSDLYRRSRRCSVPMALHVASRTWPK